MNSFIQVADDYHVLVWILKGSLAFTTILAGLLAILLYKIHKSRSTQGGGKRFRGAGKVKPCDTITASMFCFQAATWDFQPVTQ